jgi:glutamine synthetase
MPTIVEYVWQVGGGLSIAGGHFRSKVRVLKGAVATLEDIPEWNYDGSSTGQATTTQSEILIKPYLILKSANPRADFIVFCDCWYTDGPKKGQPLPDNHRAAVVAMECDTLRDAAFWFGFEQEFFVTPFPAVLEPQGPHYCSVGPSLIRNYLDRALCAGIEMGLDLTGSNMEVSPNQGELQVCAADIAAADQLIVLRWLLTDLLAADGLGLDISPKPLGPDWNGSGLHTNISTTEMRSPRGIVAIHQLLDRFKATHMDHIAVYGPGNEARLSGIHETSRLDEFSIGVGSRGASIRIPNSVLQDGCGYFEDRRPAANADPYQIVARIYETYLSTLGK